jgi:arylformamidase
MTIYKQYTQELLNNQYNTRLGVPGYAAYFESWEERSTQTRSQFAFARNIYFGTHIAECMDIFPAGKPGSKTMIFIHGGYWHLLDKELFHFLAPAFLKNNITCVFINYPLAPAVSIDEIVYSCRSAINWISENISDYNGNPSELYVSGHSAGGHLATMLLTAEDFSLLKGVISFSGIFRLEPIMLSYLNDVLHIDQQAAVRNSPVILNRYSDAPVLLVTGEDESHEFKDQSTELFNSWKHQNGAIELMNIASKNHYSILDTMTVENSPVQSSIFRLMNINE